MGLADATGTFELSRENRIRMAEALYAEAKLLAAGAESQGGRNSAGVGVVQLRQRLFDELVGVYAHAMVGVTMYERQVCMRLPSCLLIQNKTWFAKLC